MLIRLTPTDGQQDLEGLTASLRKLYKHVLIDESLGIQFLAERYLSGTAPKDQAALDRYLQERAGTTELILTDDLRSDTRYLRIIAIPGEELILDVEEEERDHWQPLLERLIQSLSYTEKF